MATTTERGAQSGRSNIKQPADFGQRIGKKERRLRRQAERRLLAGAVLFVAIIAFLVWYTDGRLVTAPLRMIISLESGKEARDPGINCQKPDNAKTPYCQERRARKEAEWVSVSRHHGGKGNAFTLHGD